MSSRRRINKELVKRWVLVGNSLSYKYAAIKKASIYSLDSIRANFFVGRLISLSMRNSGKSPSVHKRLLRRIVEKRQAQIAHRYVGHTDDLLASHIVSAYSSKCMKKLRQYVGIR